MSYAKSLFGVTKLMNLIVHSMLNKDGLHLFVDDDILLTTLCVIEKHTQVISCLEYMSHVNMIAIGTRLVVKSNPYFLSHLVQL
jgi:hypothetical protein